MTSSLRLILLLAATPMAAACGGERVAPSASAGTPVDVEAAVVRRVALPERYEAGGVIEARATAMLASRLVADVRSVLVAPGDAVRRGQVLARLDDRDFTSARQRATASVTATEYSRDAAESDLRASTAAMRLAQVSFDRVKRLQERKAATAAELDEHTANLEAARSRVAAAEARAREATASVDAARAAARGAEVGVSWTTIAAPFDGVVAEKMIDAGSQVAPGVSLFRIEDTRLRVIATIDALRARNVRIGQMVAVEASTSDAAPIVVAGRVAEIGRAVGIASQALVVKVDLPEHTAARSGQFARVRFEVGSRSVLAVPAAAVRHEGQLTQVFTVDADRRARLRPVLIGVANEAIAELLAGLSEGELVLPNPPVQLTDGTLVNVVSTRAPAEGTAQ